MTDKPSVRKVEVHRPTVEVDGLPLSEGFPVRHIELEVLDGEAAGRRFSSDRPNVRMGADPMCDCVLRDPTVSRNHAELRARGIGGVTLVDLNSTNGTYLDDDSRVDQAVLEDGQIFRLGRTRIRYTERFEKVLIPQTERTRYDNIVGQSPGIRQIFSILDRVSPSELSVVIEGETGTGKEVIAKAIHDHSLRSDGPFVVFDCSAFPPSLLESQLFGHEKGAFTGAVGRHRGVFERADGGTLFFDELGEMEIEFQAKFLRALETGTIRRVGAEKTMKVDVRIVAATNRNLQQMVANKKFRSDLFYRLAQVRFLLPALRDRVEDILPLVEHFLELQAERSGRRPTLEPEALQVLEGYSWPGNIRELRNAIEKAVAMSTEGVITAEYFAQEVAAQAASHAMMHGGSPSLAEPTMPSVTPPAMPGVTASTANLGDQKFARVTAPLVDEEGAVLPFKDVKEEVISAFERQYIELLLDSTRMNISKAARRAGIDRRHFYRLLKKHEIDTDD
jgi:DNA-binding NtrC family response regulator